MTLWQPGKTKVPIPAKQDILSWRYNIRLMNLSNNVLHFLYEVFLLDKLAKNHALDQSKAFQRFYRRVEKSGSEYKLIKIT